jgi:hypothetical protein
VSRATALVAVIVLLAVGIMPAAQHASAPSGGGHHATLRHAPRTPGGTAVADVATPAPLVPRPARIGTVPPLTAEDAPTGALAAPFVPPRS